MRRGVLVCLVAMAFSCSKNQVVEEEKEIAGNIKEGGSQYQSCVACHRAVGEGNKELNSPAIAGKEIWYIERQLINFKSGIRGAHPSDTTGAQMAPMAKLLKDEQAVLDVATFVNSLAKANVAKTISGDIANGKEYYNMVCGSCHGAGASGNLNFNAPSLVGQSDWYLLAQLKKFQDGVRGTHSDDVFGAQMQAMASSLPTDDVAQNVVAYINSLSE